MFERTYLYAISERECDCKWKTFGDSDDKNCDTNDDEFDEILHVIHCELLSPHDKHLYYES
jgi:hypothetical protein